MRSSMYARRVVILVALVPLAETSSALAFSSLPRTGRRRTALGYMTHYDAYHDILDVDGDRMSLRALLDPPAAPLEARSPPEPDVAASSSSGGRASQRASPVTALYSMQDYQRLVLHTPNQLCVIRFSAPYCKACRITQVSWERMAAKISKMSGSRIKFLAISVDGKDADTAALKELLQVDRVPLGVLHWPARGLFGQKVDLDRAGLAALRKRLEAHAMGKGGEGARLVDVPEFSL